MSRWKVSQQLNFTKCKLLGIKKQLNHTLDDFTTGHYSAFSDPSIVDAVKAARDLILWVEENWSRLEENKKAYFKGLGELTEAELDEEESHGHYNM